VAALAAGSSSGNNWAKPLVFQMESKLHTFFFCLRVTDWSYFHWARHAPSQVGTRHNKNVEELL